MNRIMEIKVMQWNIGGAYIKDSSPSYDKHDLNYIKGVLKDENPDVCFMQEIHMDEFSSDSESIARELEYYYVQDPYAESHIEAGQMLCQSIFSKFPISNRAFELFHNPYWKKKNEDGTVWTSHDKGISTCDIEFSSRKLQYKHFTKFHLIDLVNLLLIKKQKL